MNPIKLLRYAMAGWIPGGGRRCAVCEHAVWRFMPYGKGATAIPPLMAALDVVGSNADHFECPHCGAHDRERHLLLYLRASGLLEKLRGSRLMHFAPEKRLARIFAAAAPATYVRADLFPGTPEVVRVDMLAMQFGDAQFDFLIANHVLEHVADDAAALREIYRVLAPGGYAILQTPFSRVLHETWNDPGIVSAAARLQAYGQADHVRLFGRDIFARIAAAGFESRVAVHADALPTFDAATYGVNQQEPFFLFRRA